MPTNKNMTGLFDGKPGSVSHGKGKLPNVGLPSPQANADAKGAMGMSAGKGKGTQDLGAGRPPSGPKISNKPGKGSGKAQGLSAGKPRGVPQPFGRPDTRKP